MSDGVIDFELSWYEEKIKGLMELVDANSPFKDIESETETETNAKGVPIIKVISSRNDTIKLMQSILKELPDMFARLRELRLEKAVNTKLETKGDRPVSGMMEKFIKEREEKT